MCSPLKLHVLYYAACTYLFTYRHSSYRYIGKSPPHNKTLNNFIEISKLHSHTDRFSFWFSLYAINTWNRSMQSFNIHNHYSNRNGNGVELSIASMKSVSFTCFIFMIYSLFYLIFIV